VPLELASISVNQRSPIFLSPIFLSSIFLSSIFLSSIFLSLLLPVPTCSCPYFFVDIKKEGVVLYDNGKHTLVEAEPLPPAEAQQYAREDFEHWYTSASEFLDQFDFAFEKAHYNTAAFLLHQVTERFLTAVILAFGQYKAKTHDLERLDRQVCNLHADFFTVFPRGNEQQKRHFELLKKAYIDARYKRDFVITREELEYLAARVRKLQELAKRICDEHIEGMA
jgi:HEPN domain-containing protein